MVFRPGTAEARDTYRPWAGDALVVSFPDGGTAGCRPKASSSLVAITSAAVDVNYVNGNTETLDLSDRPINSLRLTTTIESKDPPRVKITTSVGSAKFPLPRFAGKSWGEIRSALAATCDATGMALGILPAEPAVAAVGDRIIVTRQSMITDAYSMDDATRAVELGRRPVTAPAVALVPPAAGTPEAQAQLSADAVFARLTSSISGAGTRDVERFELAVDSSGAINLPPITRLSAFGIDGSAGGPGDPHRTFDNASLAPPSARLVVAGIPLMRLALCLSMVTADAGHPDCPAIDASYGPANGDGGARRQVTYIIEPGARSWFLVDSHGRRLALPYRYGLSVLDAVREAFPAWQGQELPTSRGAYLTVIPDAGRHEPAFFEPLREGGMGDVLLEPGDTVHLTSWKPQQVRREGADQ